MHPDLTPPSFPIKFCTGCGLDKPHSEFHHNKAQPDGLANWCKLCVAGNSKRWYTENREVLNTQRRANWQEIPKQKRFEICHRRRLKYEYGISVEEFDALLAAQEYLCAICNREQPLCLDHDHVTNKVRGLLCRECNSMLGMAFDDPNILMAGAGYLIDKST